MAILGGDKKGPSGSGEKKKVERKPLTMKSEEEIREERRKDAEETAEFNEKHGIGKKDGEEKR